MALHRPNSYSKQRVHNFDRRSFGRVLLFSSPRFYHKKYSSLLDKSTSSSEVKTQYDSVLYSFQNFVVKKANHQEAKRFLKLRSRIFGREYRNNLIKFKKDKDVYDKHAQQVVLIDKNSGEVIGGCRMIHSKHSEDYYASMEYDMSGLMNLPGDKLEVSRVCIHSHQRHGIGLLLLWRGVLAYAHKKRMSYVFGIPSLHTTSRVEAQRFYKYCSEKGITGPILAQARPQFLTFSDHIPSPEDRVVLSKDRLPKLLSIYVKAGARICSTGAVDHDLKCIDFLTVLNMDNLAPKYRKINCDAQSSHVVDTILK